MAVMAFSDCSGLYWQSVLTYPGLGRLVTAGSVRGSSGADWQVEDTHGKATQG
jgi:hypothetical protein